MSMYKNEVDRPEQPSQGSPMKGMGMKEAKAQADDLAYGQAGSAGCKSDDKKISAQMKNYHWKDESGSSGY